MSTPKPPRSSIPLNKNLKSTIKRMADEQKKKFPDMCIELIELGLSHHVAKEKQYEFLQEITLKNHENILSTLNLVGELFYIAKGVPSKRFSKDDTVEYALDTILKTAKKTADKNRLHVQK